MRGPDIVFLGPSLTRAEARAIYPGALFLPPASMGDLLSAVRSYRPHAIALIDGSFFQSMATYHKEIIDAMRQGVWVIGASSMGALRAAECAPFGMIGVGEVFRGYNEGLIEDDDEVALSHTDEDFGFRPVTDAMVDIRASLKAAHAAGLLSDPELQSLLSQQKNRWFMERHLLESVHDATQLPSMTEHRVGEFDAYLRTHRVSVKANDAREALQVLRDLPDDPMPMDERPELPFSLVYDATSARDVVVTSDIGDPISLDKIRRFFCLTDNRSAEIWMDVRERCALHRLMVGFGVQLQESDYEAARAAIAGDLGVSPDQLQEECASLDLTTEQVQAWVREEAYIRRARAWVGGHSLYTLFTTEFLNHLRRTGEYRATRRGAAFQERVMSRSPHRHAQLGLSAAMAVYSNLSQWKPPADIDVYLAENNLGSRAEFYERLMAGVAAGMEIFGLPMIELPEEDALEHSMAPKISRGG